MPQASNILVRLQTASLRKYRTFYKLQDVAASSSKEDLIPAVAKHFAQQVCSTATKAQASIYHYTCHLLVTLSCLVLSKQVSSLLPALQVVSDEEATVMDFYHHIRKQSLSRYSPPPTKKPRVAAKALKANGR